MRVAMATSAGKPDWPNEDFVGAVPTAAVLLDGAGISGIESICRHGIAWYTHRLGGVVVGRLSRDDGADLTTILGDAIDEVTADHRDTCDVTNPSSPSATVALLRVNADNAEYLILSDSFLVLEKRDGPVVVTDGREVEIRKRYTAPLSATTEGTPEYEQALAVAIKGFRATRNQPGGFWVAKDDPRAADEAVVGSAPIADIVSAALLSNGASRVVDRFGLADWPQVMTLLATAGPAEIIRRVREAEQGQNQDDATVAYCTNLLE
jgi:hypothetical protein